MKPRALSRHRAQAGSALRAGRCGLFSLIGPLTGTEDESGRSLARWLLRLSSSLAGGLLLTARLGLAPVSLALVIIGLPSAHWSLLLDHDLNAPGGPPVRVLRHFVSGAGTGRP